jgi:hypothetical protein
MGCGRVVNRYTAIARIGPELDLPPRCLKKNS